jgi:hypothetical protein
MQGGVFQVLLCSLEFRLGDEELGLRAFEVGAGDQVALHQRREPFVFGAGAFEVRLHGAQLDAEIGRVQRRHQLAFIDMGAF